MKVVVVTNGDYYSPGVPLGYQREAETVAAMGLLGVPEQNVIFMGYGDETLQTLYQSTSALAGLHLAGRSKSDLCKSRPGPDLVPSISIWRSRSV